MTNEERKQEVIKNAYGEFYEICEPDENGWSIIWESVLFYELEEAKIEIEYLEFNSSNIWRPKTLSGIETNNNWIRIEEDGSNLPDIDSKDEFWICIENVFFDWISNARQIHVKFDNRTITHYQQIIKPNLPIY
jgi:hypothetical protein